MRNNGPVSGREVNYSADLNILSVTDAKGHITYCNDDFIKISGFTKAELMGQAHNIVRHPDIPPLAFADLWSYMKANKSWMGMVKNRCKNGDHYWVDAFATPITENGELIECQSVRSKPKREWVNRAESFYKKVNEGKSLPISGIKLPLSLKIIFVALISYIPLLLGVLSHLPILTLIFMGFIGMSANIFLTLALLNPLKSILKKSREIASNKIAQYVYTGRMDEFGEIQLAIKMLSSELGAITGRMSDASKNQSQNAQQTLNNMTKSSQASQQQSAEACQLAAGIEEMSASMKEISSNASNASQVVSNAVEMAQVANNSITQLNEYSAAIGNVIQLINSIAEQTNLLALNATIEAARAGEAGKGFAVVANEVKDLASQTAKATEDVSTKVQGIQGATTGSMHAMKEICEVIEKINHYQGSIAAAVEEQSAVTSEMSLNISIISDKTTETASVLQDTQQLSQQLADDVSVSERLSAEFRKVIQRRNNADSRI